MAILVDEPQDKTAGRHPLVQNEIFSLISRQIFDGSLKVGGKLPIRKEMMTKFSTTSTTIQRVFDLLLSDGYLVSRMKKGTFVAEHPPCLFRIGLCFAHKRNGKGWRGMDEAIMRVAEEIEAQTPYSFSIYEGLESDVSKRGKLLEQLNLDVQQLRVKGLIFATPTFYLPECLALTQKDLPRVIIQNRPDQPGPFTSIIMGNGDFLGQSIEHLAKKGCQRIAVLSTNKHHEDLIPQLQAKLSRHQLVYDPAWVQSVPLETSDWVNNLIQLLFHSRTKNKPDGLIVTDDTTLPQVMKGLELTECRLGEDLQVVSHCNFPLRSSSDPNLYFLGADIRAFFRTALKTLEARRMNRSAAGHIVLELKDENEVMDADSWESFLTT